MLQSSRRSISCHNSKRGKQGGKLARHASYVVRCALARRSSSRMRFLCGQMRSRSTLADPNAFPMCSRVLSLVKPFSNSGTAPRNHVRFDQVRVNRTPFQPGSGSGHVRAQIHRPGAVSYLIGIVCFGHLFNPDLAQAIFEIKLLASIASI